MKRATWRRTWACENLVVTLDYNDFGIDGPITEVMPCALPEPLVRARLEHDRGGWPQSPRTGLRLPAGRRGLRHGPAYRGDLPHHARASPTADWKAPADSHGTPLPHEEYVEAMRKLGFAIPGVRGRRGRRYPRGDGSPGRAESEYLIERLAAAARADRFRRGAGGAHADRRWRAGRCRTTRAIERPAELPRGTGIPGRRLGGHAQGHGSVVCLGHEAHRVLLRGRRAT